MSDRKILKCFLYDSLLPRLNWETNGASLTRFRRKYGGPIDNQSIAPKFTYFFKLSSRLNNCSTSVIYLRTVT